MAHAGVQRAQDPIGLLNMDVGLSRWSHPQRAPIALSARVKTSRERATDLWPAATRPQAVDYGGPGLLTTSGAGGTDLMDFRTSERNGLERLCPSRLVVGRENAANLVAICRPRLHAQENATVV
jgi:hypothetical protein